MKKLLLLFFAIMVTGVLSAQVSLTTAGTPSTIDFTGFLGTGFDATPAAGQLSSNTWATNGFSDGSLAFGGTNTSGDHAKGVVTTPGGTLTGGGLYALDNAGNTMMWIQATGSDFSPGDVTVRIQNNTGAALTGLNIAYDLVVFNDAGRASSFNFSYSTDDVTYTAVSALDYTSTEAADATPALVTNNKSTAITGLSIAAGGYAYIRWTSDDVSGSGSRDEFGLDNISITGTTGGVVVFPGVIHNVAVASNSFTPANLTINVGDSVVWTNTSGTHNINGTTATFANNPVGFTNGSPSSSAWVYGVKFDTPGLYNYQCDPHAGSMQGTVTVLPPPPTASVDFLTTAVTVAENAGTITADVTIMNPSATLASTVNVMVMGTSTATNGSDYTYTSPTTVTFAAGSTTAQTVSIVITDDAMLESDETIVLKLTNATGAAFLGADSVMTITITDNDYVVTNALVLTGIYDGPVSSSPKGYEFYAVSAISDLSKFGVGAANNGGGTDGQEYTFPAVAIPAGTFFYLANDTAAFSAFFGFPAQFQDALSTGVNGDDAVEIFEGGQVIDLFGDINMSGSGTAWDYLDTWAYRDCATGPDTTFNVSDWTIAPINMFDNQTTNLTSPIPMPVMTYSTACPQGIVTNDDIVTVAFNTATTFSPLNNDALPGLPTNAGISTQPTNGTLTFNLITATATYTPNPGFCGTDMAAYFLCDAQGCDTATITFNVACPIPTYTISQVVGLDANGVADSVDVVCELQGIVYGIDFRGGNGYSFTLIDATDGINVFAFNDVPSAYIVNEGDEIRVVGTITAFNGLTEIVVDTIQLVSTFNALKTPTIVTTLDETTESDLVKIEAVTLIDPAQWTNAGSGFNVAVRNATDTIMVRIDADCDLFGTTAPTGWFNVTGIGAQYDNSSPYTEGYQLFPRYQADIELLSNTNNTAALANNVKMFPNPANNYLTIVSDVTLTTVRISNMLGQEVMSIQTPNATATVNVSALPKGVYAITFMTETAAWTQQFVKN